MKKLITLVIVILFFIISYYCTAQAPPMRFTTDSGAVYVVLHKQPLTDTVLYTVLVFFEHSRADYSVSIGFSGGRLENMPLLRRFYRYNEYFIDRRALAVMKREPFDVLFIETAARKYVCPDINTKDYFIRGLN